MKKYQKKIVFVFRFFSGLQGIRDSIWEPKGVPAIYKLLEEVNKQGVYTEVVFLCKTIKESEGIHKKIGISISELPNIQFTIVPFRKYVPILRINFLINSARHFIFVTCFVSRFKPCLIYCDRVHLSFGAWFAWFKKQKVVVRMLGVEKYVDFYKKRLNALLHPIRFFSLRAPFAHIICSKDGSPGHYVLQKYANKNTPYVVWLNGVDKQGPPFVNQELYLGAGKIKMLFIGRLEQDKGIIELVQALKQVKDAKRNNFELHVVGSGSLGGQVEAMVKEYALGSHVFLRGEVEHKDISQWYKQADACISLNKLGNLSNIVLEALSLGKCMILLKGDGIVDKDTDEILPEDVAFKVDRNNIVDDLSEKIKFILDNPDCIAGRADKTKEIADVLLVSWEERINKEIDLLNNICR